MLRNAMQAGAGIQTINMKNLKGLIVPIITPKNNNQVDEESLIKLIHHLINGGVDGIFILGTTGEFPHLNLVQKKTVVKIVAKIINKKILLLVGVNSKTIDETLSLINFCQQQSVDYIILSPLYNNNNPENLINKVIESSNLPIVLYNNPGIQNNNSLPLNFIRKIIKNKKIVGIKDSSGDFGYFKELIVLSNDQLKVFQGRTSPILESLKIGAAGIVSGLANIETRLFKDLILTKDENLMEKALNLQKNIKKLSKNTIQGIKIALVDKKIIKTAQLFN